MRTGGCFLIVCYAYPHKNSNAKLELANSRVSNTLSSCANSSKEN